MAAQKGKIPPQFLQNKKQVALQQAQKKGNSTSGKKPNFPGADPSTQNNVEGYTYADLPQLRKEEKGLESQQLKITDPVKKQKLHQQELRLESIIKRLVAPQGN